MKIVLSKSSDGKYADPQYPMATITFISNKGAIGTSLEEKYLTNPQKVIDCINNIINHETFLQKVNEN